MTTTIDEMEPFARAVYEIDRLQNDPSAHLSLQMDADTLSAARAAMTTGQTASVTVTLVFKRKGDAVEVSGNCKPKIPKPATFPVKLYTDDDGQLFHHNPSRAASVLPGVDVRPPPRRQTAKAETPINAKKE